MELLTDRSLFAENCFLTAYRLVRNLPDLCEALLSIEEERKSVDAIADAARLEEAKRGIKVESFSRAEPSGAKDDARRRQIRGRF